MSLGATQYKGGWVFAPRGDAANLARVIPYAKTLVSQGVPLLAVPHTLPSVDMLRSLGVQCDSPINHDGFVYGGRFTPHPHQRDTCAFFTAHERGFNFDPPGMGKTASTIWTAEYLMQRGLIRRVLVLSTLSTLRTVWERELFVVAPHRSAAVVQGSAKLDRTNKITDSRIRWVIMNHDGVPHNLNALLAANDIDLVVVDECTAFKHPTSNRYKALRKTVMRPLDHGGQCRLWALTGTPTAQSLVDAWAMARMVNPDGTPPSYVLAKDAVMQKVGQFKWVPRRGAADIVHGWMQPAVRHSKADCLTLPAVTVVNRTAPLSSQQRLALTELEQTSKVKLASGQVIMAVNAAVEVSKRLQVCAGIIIDEQGRPLAVDADDRLQTIADLVAESASKSIVFCAFKGALARTVEHLEAQGFSVAAVDGSVSETARSAIFRAFQEEEHPQVLVAHPKTASHGLTLTAASTIVWNGPTMSSELYIQGNNRIDRPGQKHFGRVVNLYSTPLEKKVFDAIKERGLTAEDLLDMYGSFM
jgi:superfamily II DNA or RNA helicase